MEITTDELMAAFQEAAAENAILRRRLAIKDGQIRELTQALNQRTLDETPPGGTVRVALDEQGQQVGPAVRLADQVDTDGEPDGEAHLRKAIRQSDQVLKMHALSPDMTVRGKALRELLGREPDAAELDDPERTLAGLYEAEHTD